MFDSFINFSLNWSDVFKILLAVLLAFLPALIWIKIIYSDKEKNPKFILWIFISGCLTVLPILALQFLWYFEPQFDLYTYLEKDLFQKGIIQNVHLGFFFTYIAVGIIEEVGKYLGLRYIDATKIKIESINDSLKYIVVIALGFAFSENILYFSNFFLNENISISESFFSIVFRSVFTTCAHMIFAGITGYYFAISKFAKPILQQSAWEGNKHSILKFSARVLWLEDEVLFAFIKRNQGLLIASTLHAFFNFLLHEKIPGGALTIVIIGFIFIYYLMHRKSGQLIFLKEQGHQSLMANKDEEVVIELLGIWLNEGKYKEVEEICDRLLQKDPDSNIVKLFKAKAQDKLKVKNALKSITGLFRDNNNLQEEESLFAKYKKIKEQGAKITKDIFTAKIPAITEENEKVITELLEMWLSEGKYKEVEEICDRILKIHPANIKVQNLKNQALGQHKIDKAYGTIRSLFSKEDYQEEESLFQKYKKIKNK